jgi:hypothetical protein
LREGQEQLYSFAKLRERDPRLSVAGIRLS